MVVLFIIILLLVHVHYFCNLFSYWFKCSVCLLRSSSSIPRRQCSRGPNIRLVLSWKLSLTFIVLEDQLRLVAKTLSQSQGGRVLFRTRRKTKKDKVLQFLIFAKTLVLITNNPDFVPLFARCRYLRPQNLRNPPFSPYHSVARALTLTIPITSTMFHTEAKSKLLPDYFQKSYSSCSVSATIQAVWTFYCYLYDYSALFWYNQ